MLLDSQGLFSENQAITTGTIYSTNIIKTGLGDVSFVPVIIQVMADFTNLTSLLVKVQTSSDEAFTSPVDLAQSSLALASLKKGTKYPISYLPKGNLGYMRLVYVVTGTDETTGKITASITAGDGISYHEI